MTHLEDALRREAAVLRESLALDVTEVVDTLRAAERVHLDARRTAASRRPDRR